MMGWIDTFGRPAILQASTNPVGNKSSVGLVSNFPGTIHSENLKVLVENTRPDTYVGESRELCDRGLGVWRQATAGQ